MLDDRYFELERLHGTDAARLAAESHTAAIGRIESIVAKEGIDCDFTRLRASDEAARRAHLRAEEQRAA